MKMAILDAVATLNPGQVVDASRITENGAGIRVIANPGLRTALLKIGDTNIYAVPKSIQRITNILNTV